MTIPLDKLIIFAGAECYVDMDVCPGKKGIVCGIDPTSNKALVNVLGWNSAYNPEHIQLLLHRPDAALAKKIYKETHGIDLPDILTIKELVRWTPALISARYDIFAYKEHGWAVHYEDLAGE